MKAGTLTWHDIGGSSNASACTTKRARRPWQADPARNAACRCCCCCCAAIALTWGRLLRNVPISPRISSAVCCKCGGKSANVVRLGTFMVAGELVAQQSSRAAQYATTAAPTELSPESPEPFISESLHHLGGGVLALAGDQPRAGRSEPAADASLLDTSDEPKLAMEPDADVENGEASRTFSAEPIASDKAPKASRRRSLCFVFCTRRRTSALACMGPASSAAASPQRARSSELCMPSRSTRSSDTNESSQQSSSPDADGSDHRDTSPQRTSSVKWQRACVAQTSGGKSPARIPPDDAMPARAQ